MTLTDPIADMLTRIRNAMMKNHEVVEIPSSKVKLAMAEIFKTEGFIRDFHTADYKNQGKIMVHLKYVNGTPAIAGMKRVSTPGRRFYQKSQEIKPVYHGTGVGIFSTPQGILTDTQAREKKVGGEYLLNIW